MIFLHFFNRPSENRKQYNANNKLDCRIINEVDNLFERFICEYIQRYFKKNDANKLALAISAYISIINRNSTQNIFCKPMKLMF